MGRDRLMMGWQRIVRPLAVGLPWVLALAQSVAGAELVPAGRYVWSEARSDFGGLSDLIVTGAGRKMVAISDEGELFQAGLERSAGGEIGGVNLTRADRPLDNKGQPVSGFRQDAEDLTYGRDGALYVSFEGYARVAGFKLPDMTPHPTNRWDQFESLWGNEGFEGLATLPDGRLMVVIEVATGGSYRTLVHGAGGWKDGPRLPASGTYQASGLDVGPDGRLYLLERDYSLIWGFATRVRRFAFTPKGVDAGEVLYDTPDGGSENFEGISVWRDDAGQMRVSLISDNNFAAGVATVIAEFRLEG